MICGIHYFFTKLKTKIDVIPNMSNFQPFEVVGRGCDTQLQVAENFIKLTLLTLFN